MAKNPTVKYNVVCPACYAETGYSIVMREENGIYYCPNNPSHKYKLDENGFLVKTESW